MAITIPPSLQVPSEYETSLSKVTKQPLKKLLEDLNYLFVNHRPAIASHCLTSAPALSRTAKFIVPIAPSADGIKYKLETRIWCSTACNLTLTIDYCTAYTYNSGGPWTVLADHSGVHALAVAGAGLVTQVDTATIPSDAIALRVSCSVSAGTHTPHHLLVYPYPDAPTVTTYPSGFILFDDGMLNSAQHSPITTEHLNRCKVSPDAIRRDRQQVIYSWCQDEVQANARTVIDNYTAAVHFPAVRCWLPGQALKPGQPVTITVKMLCSTNDASTGTGLVSLTQMAAGTGQAFDAQTSGTMAIQTKTFQVIPQGEGLMRFVDLELQAKSVSAKKTYIHAITAYWLPGD
jgi:hypothetical protein